MTDAVDAVLHAALAEAGVPFERTAPGEYLVHLAGEHRLDTATWFAVGRQSVVVEAFFCRRPDEDPEPLYRFLLERNATMYGVHFAVDRLGDIYLVGRVPLVAVTPEEVDRLLGCVLSYSDGMFDTAVRLGFAGAIQRELAWRRSRGLSAENLRRYVSLDDA